MEEIAQALGISHGSVSTILPDRLGMREPTAHWVPKPLSNEQMATRASVCGALLKRFRSLFLVSEHTKFSSQFWHKNKRRIPKSHCSKILNLLSEILQFHGVHSVWMLFN